MVQATSITARDPDHLAGGRAGFIGDTAAPYPPNSGRFFALSGDGYESGVELSSPGRELRRGGDGGADFATGEMAAG
jgi:hypothetical protein